MKFLLAIFFCLPLCSYAQSKVEEVQSKIPVQKLNRLFFDVAEADIRVVLQDDIKNTLRKGQVLDHKIFLDECNRIAQVVNRHAYPPFTTSKVTYSVDSISETTYNLKIVVKTGNN